MRFDLAQGHPHPPGYPLLVLLGRVAMRAVGDPSHALSLVSAVAFAVTASSAFTIAWRATRSRRPTGRQPGRARLRARHLRDGPVDEAAL
ncbi:MAG: DUF2723 domain-containing protein [Nocardioides sp.]